MKLKRWIATALFLSLTLSLELGCRPRSESSDVKAADDVVVDKLLLGEIRADLVSARSKNELLKDARLSITEAASVEVRNAARKKFSSTVTKVAVELQSVIAQFQAKLASPGAEAGVTKVANVPKDEFTAQLNTLNKLAQADGPLDGLKEKANDYAAAAQAGGTQEAQARAAIDADIIVVTNGIDSALAVVDSWLAKLGGAVVTDPVIVQVKTTISEFFVVG